MIKRKNNTLFPYDFYSGHKGWRFAVRAMDKTEVIDAMFWLSFLTLHREKINLLLLSSDKFHYHIDHTNCSSTDICLHKGARMDVKMVGPIIEVKTLNDAVKK